MTDLIPGGTEMDLRQKNWEQFEEIERLRRLVEQQSKALDWIRANKGAHPENIAKVIEQFCPVSSTSCTQDDSGEHT